MLQQHGAGYHPARIAQKVFQQPEFLGLKVDVPPGALGGAADQVDFQVGAAKPHGLAGAFQRGGAARDRTDARHEFGKGERLDQIVVAAALQPFHPVVQSAHGGQEENGRDNAFVA